MMSADPKDSHIISTMKRAILCDISPSNGPQNIIIIIIIIIIINNNKAKLKDNLEEILGIGLLMVEGSLAFL